MRILMDAMGGDNAPESVVLGGIRAAKAYNEEIILVGDEKQIQDIIKTNNAQDIKNITVVHAPDVVDMHDDPATALRKRPESSMTVAFKMLKAGEGDAIVSAGSTGALLSGATLYGGRIKGIRRAALAALMPCAGGQFMLLDVGANTECTAEFLLQFAFMGSLYMEKMQGISKPRVGLVNNGSEDTKGDALRLETYALLKAASDFGKINFVGNVEARDVPLGACDVAVIDGFCGNIMLKTIEGTAKFLSGAIKNVFTANALTKLSYLACKGGMDDFKELFNQDKIGGAPFMGISKPVIKAHGSSNDEAFMNAVRQSIAYANSGMIEAVKENIEYMTIK